MATDDRGFSLVETMVALFLLVSGVLGTAAVLHQSTSALVVFHRTSHASSAAHAKVAQWRALVWEYHETTPGTLVGVADVETDLSASPPSLGGAGVGAGRGLDHVDAFGGWAGGATPLSAAHFVRRWDSQPHPTLPDVMILQVGVEPIQWSAGSGGPTMPMAVGLVSLRGRMVR